MWSQSFEIAASRLKYLWNHLTSLPGMHSGLVWQPWGCNPHCFPWRRGLRTPLWGVIDGFQLFPSSTSASALAMDPPLSDQELSKAVLQKSRFFYATSSSGRISLERCLFAYWSDVCLAPSSFLWNLFPYTFVLLTSLCNHPLLRCKAFIIWVYAVDIWARRQSWRGTYCCFHGCAHVGGHNNDGGVFSAVEGISTVKIWSHLPFWQYSKRCCVWELSIEM